jgi:release factor glutamine methyltransferase
LRHGDLLEGTGEFDVIVANLPYVAESEYETLDPEIRSWEPPDALVGGATGTEAIARLLSQAPAHLADGGVLGTEIGATQAKELITIARGFFPEADVYVMKDLAGLDRMLVVRRGRG